MAEDSASHPCCASFALAFFWGILPLPLPLPLLLLPPPPHRHAKVVSTMATSDNLHLYVILLVYKPSSIAPADTNHQCDLGQDAPLESATGRLGGGGRT